MAWGRERWFEIELVVSTHPRSMFEVGTVIFRTSELKFKLVQLVYGLEVLKLPHVGGVVRILVSSPIQEILLCIGKVSDLTFLTPKLEPIKWTQNLMPLRGFILNSILEFWTLIPRFLMSLILVVLFVFIQVVSFDMLDCLSKSSMTSFRKPQNWTRTIRCSWSTWNFRVQFRRTMLFWRPWNTQVDFSSLQSRL